MRPRSHAPSGVALPESDGRAARAPWISSVRRYVLPRLVMPSRRVLPPVLACRGTSPSQAARSRARLPGHEPEPGGEVSRSPEGLTRADRRNQRSRVESPKARDRGEPPRRLVLSRPRHELGSERCDPPVELAPFQTHVFNQEADTRAQGRRWFGAVVDHPFESVLKPA